MKNLNFFYCFFLQIFWISAVLGQSNTKKVILHGHNAYTLDQKNDFLYLEVFSLSQNIQGKPSKKIPLKIKYSNNFSYPFAWDMADSANALIVELISNDRFWANTHFIDVPINKLFTSSSATIGEHIKYIGGSMTPLNYKLFWQAKGFDLNEELHFDIARPDTSHLRLFTHCKSRTELEVWSFDITQDLSKLRDTIMVEEFRRYWKNEANYPLALDGYFSALTCKGKNYIVTQDGAVYRLDGKTAEVVKRLPGRLDNGILIVNKDTDEVHYLPARAFRQDRSLAESMRLEGAKILPE